ncbi:MAG: 3-dehydroquinate synthase [Actinomycetaceae bacterium]|nr:3-dehydroquinate synthase [Actinomycetaceae bacterium]
MLNEPIYVKAERTYPVEVTPGGLSTRLVPLISELNAQKVLVVCSDNLIHYLKVVTNQLKATDLGFETLLIPAGEAGKTAQIIEGGWHLASAMGLERNDLVLTLGGGAVTDLGGFLAATWLRGVKLMHVPTSLLGMVDAAVGGKTAINTPSGKNLVGSFYSPHAVLVDPQLLQTLPKAEFTSGVAEIIKSAVIADAQMLPLLESKIQADSPQLAELIHRTINVKAKIVSEDFHEAAQREILNYGHTLAHAIEKLSNYQIRHGEAVAVGMVFAARLSAHLNVADETWVQRQTCLIKTQQLPTSWESYRTGDLIEQMRRDKKVRAGQLRFVLSSASHTGVQIVGVDDVQAVLEGQNHG